MGRIVSFYSRFRTLTSCAYKRRSATVTLEIVIGDSGASPMLTSIISRGLEGRVAGISVHAVGRRRNVRVIRPTFRTIADVIVSCSNTSPTPSARTRDRTHGRALVYELTVGAMEARETRTTVVILTSDTDSIVLTGTGGACVLELTLFLPTPRVSMVVAWTTSADGFQGRIRIHATRRPGIIEETLVEGRVTGVLKSTVGIENGVIEVELSLVTLTSPPSRPFRTTQGSIGGTGLGLTEEFFEAIGLDWTRIVTGPGFDTRTVVAIIPIVCAWVFGRDSRIGGRTAAPWSVTDLGILTTLVVARASGTVLEAPFTGALEVGPRRRSRSRTANEIIQVTRIICTLVFRLTDGSQELGPA